jgi:hypothetical protein
MTKLADAIRRSQRTESTPMGFGAARPAAKATMLVGLIGQDGTADADVVLIDGRNGALSKENATKARETAGEKPVGIWLAKAEPAAAREARESGIDFVIFDPAATPAASLLDEDLGYVLTLRTDPDELFLRSLDTLNLDALYLEEIQTPFTVARQIELNRIGMLAHKPLVCRVRPGLSSDDLQCLRKAGVVLLLVEGTAADVATLKETVMSLPPRRARGEDRPVVSLPRGQAAQHDHEDDDDDD